jgi:hypothetical protein
MRAGQAVVDRIAQNMLCLPAPSAVLCPRRGLSLVLGGE